MPTFNHSGPVCYCTGYKYQSQSQWWIDTNITGYSAEVSGFVKLDSSGRLTLSALYAWDGPSGPTFDTPDFILPSLAHDGGYQLLRETDLPETLRAAFDSLLYDLCLQCGMSEIRARYVYEAVKLFAQNAAAKKAKKLFYVDCVAVNG